MTDYIVGIVLDQRIDKKPHEIYYVSHSLNEMQVNCTVIEDFLTVVFGFQKFRTYLIRSHVVVFTNHASLRHVFKKKDAKPRLIRWIMLLQEFGCEIKHRRGSQNLVANHLSRIMIDNASEPPIFECFPDEQLYRVQLEPWYANIANYWVIREMPREWTKDDYGMLPCNG